MDAVMTQTLVDPQQQETLRTSRHCLSVTVEHVIDDATARRFYDLYVDTFGELAIKAVARQVLHEDEFMEEMKDPRIEKYVAWDENGEAVAMCTLTNHLETVPWISPAYFAHHYPEHTARDAVYYLGFILVAHSHRRSRLFLEMIRRVSQTLVEKRAMCGYDICSYNNEVLGLSASLDTMLQSMAHIDVAAVDTQTYYRAIALGPRSPLSPTMVGA
jgi:hypothetical protein